MAIEIVNVVNCNDNKHVIGTLMLNTKEVNIVALDILIKDYKDDNQGYNWTDFLGYLDSKGIPYMVIHPEVAEF
jgi:hypothetical protein